MLLEGRIAKRLHKLPWWNHANVGQEPCLQVPVNQQRAFVHLERLDKRWNKCTKYSAVRELRTNERVQNEADEASVGFREYGKGFGGNFQVVGRKMSKERVTVRTFEFDQAPCFGDKVLVLWPSTTN